jgi:hypothetical protein
MVIRDGLVLPRSHLCGLGGTLGQEVEMFAGGLPDEMRARRRVLVTVDEDAARRRAHWPSYQLPNGLSSNA